MSAYINEKFVNQPYIPIEDLGFLRGYGVFEYLRAYNGKLFHLKEHLIRLLYSAHAIGLSSPKSLEELMQIANELASKQPTVRLIITGGISQDEFISSQSAFYGTSAPLLSQISPFPIALKSTKLQRSFASVKTLHYIPGIIARKEAVQQGFQEALFTTSQGEILEATTSNVFVWKKDRLITSNSDQILRGITRALILRLVKGEFIVEERPLFYEELSEVTEAFTSSSIKEILSVSQIDCFQFLGGPYTNRLKQLFSHYIASAKWEELDPESYLPRSYLSNAKTLCGNFSI